MSDYDRTRCPHCHAELETPEAKRDFWIRCGGCGRRVMPRSWSLIVNDPEPSALFRPTTIERRGGSVSPRAFTGRIVARPTRVRLSRNQLFAVAIPTMVASATSCLMFASWYSTADMLICGFMGLLLAVFVIYVPQLLVSVGTGAITLAFFSALFGFSGSEFIRGAYYFLFGFALASVLQVVNANLGVAPESARPSGDPSSDCAGSESVVASTLQSTS